jgi:hypothetical protein
MKKFLLKHLWILKPVSLVDFAILFFALSVALDGILK